MSNPTARPSGRREPHTPQQRRAAAAPIDYAEIRRVHQAVRIGIAAAVAALAVLAVAGQVQGGTT